MSESPTRLPAAPGPDTDCAPGSACAMRRLDEDLPAARELLGKPEGVGLFDLRTTEQGVCACTLCGVCAKKCPVDCIDVRRHGKVSKGEGATLALGSIRIDEARCIGCGHCVESCAFDALVPTAAYERRREFFKTLATKEQGLASGHGLCSGCGASVVVNLVLAALETPYVAAAATGCLEVSTTRYPYTAWRGSFIHTLFENAAATLSGVETAYRALKRKGEIEEEVKFIAFGGDGGTYDIGLQALSGAMERGHDMLYVCYDNGAYMNTGFQRSSATPIGAWTSTSPVGSEGMGKLQHSKNLTEIMVAHRLKYVAQASPHDPLDLVRKARKALETPGATFLNILSPCPRGWRTENDETIDLAREATETCFWPLFEVENGHYRLTYRPRKKKPLAAWMERQGRFDHLAREDEHELFIAIQQFVDDEWDLLLRKCGEVSEAEWGTRKLREEELELHPVRQHLESLGEPLTASMTETALEVTSHLEHWRWPAISSAMSWGGFDEED
jgi:pyruvate ferredoxin oxidoreductase beta subunit